MLAQTDRNLLNAYSASDNQEAFAKLVSRHGPMVYRVCKGLLHDVGEAEDAAQAVFVVLARKAAKLRRPERLSQWLYGVARNVAHQALQAREKRIREADEVSDPRVGQANICAGLVG